LACGIDLKNELPEDLYFYEYYKEEPFLHIYDHSQSNKVSDSGSFWKFDKDNLKSYAIYDNK